MQITTDEAILFKSGFIVINNTLLYSWVVMAILIIIAFIFRRKFVFDIKKTENIGNLQLSLEALVQCIENQIKEITTRSIEVIFPFMATLFLYIAVSNLISLIPFTESPTGSYSTTVALGISVFVFSTIYGFREKGFGYLKKFIEPVAFLLPLNIVGELSKVLSLTIRLYGNIMSSGVIITILSQIIFLSVGFPVVINLLGTITGVIQAYIFAILSMIFISVDN